MRQKSNIIFQNEYKSVTKEYKNTVRRRKRNFSHQLTEKLRNIKNSDPKLFWDLLNSSSKDSGKYPSCKDFFEMFSNMGKGCGGNTSSDQEVPNVSFNIDQGDPVLNGSITEEEIIRAVKN